MTKVLVALGAAGGLAVSLGATAGQATSSVTPLPSDTAATQAFVPFTVPVASLPAATSSPAVDPAAPYTPVVVSLIAQLEGGTPTLPVTQPLSSSGTTLVADLANADAMLHGGTNATCNNVGPDAAPASPTPDGTVLTPSVLAICWTDAQGVNVTKGNNTAHTTGPADLMGLGSSFDTNLANVWGQT
jgi:hypothetical protein